MIVKDIQSKTEEYRRAILEALLSAGTTGLNKTELKTRVNKEADASRETEPGYSWYNRSCFKGISYKNVLNTLYNEGLIERSDARSHGPKPYRITEKGCAYLEALKGPELAGQDGDLARKLHSETVAFLTAHKIELSPMLMRSLGLKFAETIRTARAEHNANLF